MSTGRDKTVAETRTETYHIVRPGDLNSANRLYGGILMSWIDEVAALVARRHAQMPVTTVSVDNLKFLQGAYLRDTVVVCGKATFVGNTSMEVKVDTYVERLEGSRDLINRAYLTLVGLDENDRPARLPRLILETGEDEEEWNDAQKRRQMRAQQAREGFHFYK